MGEEERDVSDALGVGQIDVIDTAGAFELSDRRVSRNDESKRHGHALSVRSNIIFW